MGHLTRAARRNPEGDGKLFWWLLGGLGGLGVGGLIIGKVLSNKPPAAPAPPPVTVSLTGGAQTVSAKPGAVITFNLPADSSWGSPLSVASGNVSPGSLPSGGSNPAGLTYNGGGAVLNAYWNVGSFGPLLSESMSETVTIVDG